MLKEYKKNSGVITDSKPPPCGRSTVRCLQALAPAPRLSQPGPPHREPGRRRCCDADRPDHPPLGVPPRHQLLDPAQAEPRHPRNHRRSFLRQERPKSPGDGLGAPPPARSDMPPAPSAHPSAAPTSSHGPSPAPHIWWALRESRCRESIKPKPYVRFRMYGSILYRHFFWEI